MCATRLNAVLSFWEVPRLFQSAQLHLCMHTTTESTCASTVWNKTSGYLFSFLLLHSPLSHLLTPVQHLPTPQDCPEAAACCDGNGFPRISRF